MSDTFNAIVDLSVLPGQPVSILDDTRVTLAADSSRLAAGLTKGAVPNGHTAIIQTNGILTLDDWSPVVGTRELMPGVEYYLSSVAGQLTASITGQLVGEATSRHSMLIRIDTVAAVVVSGGGGGIIDGGDADDTYGPGGIIDSGGA